jgi:PAS domain S-box-containing protein
LVGLYLAKGTKYIMEQGPKKQTKHMIAARHQSEKDEAKCDVDAAMYNRLKELEELFHRSEERYCALAQATAQITWTRSPDGQVGEDMPFWRAYTGQSEAEIKGWGWLSAVHPEDHVRIRDAWRQAVADKGIYEIEYRAMGADGIYRHFLVRGMPVFAEDGTLREWIGISTDITERKIMEDQAIARAIQLEAIFETITDGVLVYDSEGNITRANAAARNILNLKSALNFYEHSAYERLNLYEMKDEQGNELPFEQIPLVRILHGAELTGNNAVDIQLRLPGGRRTQLNVSGAPMRNKEGRIVGAVSVFRDVTERRDLDEERLNILATIHENNIQLEQINKIQSDFISIISHEFRTTLTGIQGFSELLRDGDFGEGEVKEYATDINTDALRLSRMISELLDLERMKSGKMMFRQEPLNLNALLIEVIEHARANVTHHPIYYALDESFPEIMGDSDKLMQVTTNLLSNAVKYSPAGGDIWITSRREGNFVRVSVQDSGIGIPAYALDKLFVQYSRIDSEKTRYIHGTGLGLSIVKQIVQTHGGMVGVESKLDQGSTFYFTLPL